MAESPEGEEANAPDCAPEVAPLGSGPDVYGVAVRSALQGVALCSACIARKADLPRWRVVDALQRLGTSAALTSEMATCKTCRRRDRIYRLTT
jgi:hypothetical protein